MQYVVTQQHQDGPDASTSEVYVSKEVFMQTRVEPELRARFYAAAASEDLAASHVIRQLMRNYVERRETEIQRVGQLPHSGAQQEAPTR